MNDSSVGHWKLITASATLSLATASVVDHNSKHLTAARERLRVTFKRWLLAIEA
jgi:hypothetical protein